MTTADGYSVISPFSTHLRIHRIHTSTDLMTYNLFRVHNFTTPSSLFLLLPELRNPACSEVITTSLFYIYTPVCYLVRHSPVDNMIVCSWQRSVSCCKSVDRTIHARNTCPLVLTTVSRPSFAPLSTLQPAFTNQEHLPANLAH